jgi:flagellar basal-body rod protein FlgG
MIESLQIAATGMNSQQALVDVIANNLANINTTAFKKSRVEFADLMYATPAAGGPEIDLLANQAPFGVGSAVAGVSKVFTEGQLKKTEAPLDLGIRGIGFFEVVMPDGSFGYTRTGSFRVNQDGVLSTAEGYPLSPLIEVPPDSKNLVVKADGTVTVELPNDEGVSEIGRIELSSFVSPSGLRPLGNNLYLPTTKSGEALRGKPTEDPTVGELAQGFLEASNVDMVQELTNLLLGQRAYEMNSRVVQASDEMLRIVNDLRR